MVYFIESKQGFQIENKNRFCFLVGAMLFTKTDHGFCLPICQQLLLRFIDVSTCITLDLSPTFIGRIMVEVICCSNRRTHSPIPNFPSFGVAAKMRIGWLKWLRFVDISKESHEDPPSDDFDVILTVLHRSHTISHRYACSLKICNPKERWMLQTADFKSKTHLLSHFLFIHCAQTSTSRFQNNIKPRNH